MITKFWFELNEKITYASIERPPKNPVTLVSVETVTLTLEALKSLLGTI